MFGLNKPFAGRQRPALTPERSNWTLRIALIEIDFYRAVRILRQEAADPSALLAGHSWKKPADLLIELSRDDNYRRFTVPQVIALLDLMRERVGDVNAILSQHTLSNLIAAGDVILLTFMLEHGAIVTSAHYIEAARIPHAEMRMAVMQMLLEKNAELARKQAA